MSFGGLLLLGHGLILEWIWNSRLAAGCFIDFPYGRFENPAETVTSDQIKSYHLANIVLRGNLFDVTITPADSIDFYAILGRFVLL